ncbi:MAG: hypoxanthine phosphoribosyltransferase [Desulfohalobiaceae bacterium]|nr:hypoxanthine phosphoribosyltransferase [Desulfohalobiaceae bacterium]
MSELREVFSREEIQTTISQLAAKINHHYQDCSEPVVAVCVLKGAVVFFSDLIRNLRFDLEVDFVRLASYGKETFRGEKVIFSKDMEIPIADKHVLIVEDIVDTGTTVNYLARVLATRRPKSVKICTLVQKLARREIQLNVDFYGFELDRGFIVGYGLDFAEQYRNLPNICELVE